MPDVPVEQVPTDRAPARPILHAELLAIGTELTVGETVDTNSGDLARSLVAHGVTVTRIANLPDDLAVVVDAMRTALDRADLVVTTGGLGPTPDDLTREAVAEVCGETVMVDQGVLTWLQGLWARRGHPFPSTNIKQAWIIPSATSLPNPNGTAPGWWVDRPDGRVIVDLPGPPREMLPMWADTVLPRLAERGVGGDSEVRTLRLFGIGESQVAELLGEALLRAANPIVATYARHEAVDVRVSARAGDGRSASELAAETEATVLAILGEFVWARGDATWARSLDEALAERGWTLATTEEGTDGALVTLLRGMTALRRAEVRVGEAGAHASPPPAVGEPELREAERVRAEAMADVGLAIRAGIARSDTPVTVAVVTPEGRHAEKRLAFQRGRQGADRAAINGAAVLLAVLRGTQRG
jgi:nicotinamide-nucleotide amidase